jgi:hypothetical protein
MVMGFSGSRGTEHIGAFYTGRWANGTTPDKPVLIQSGRAFFPDYFWGNYSYTSLDPNGSTFWTVQEYAGTSVPGYGLIAYGTWISSIKK